ncbi:cytochrome c oxidase subunit 5b-2, mitochondrial-like [Lotus japonicus]|uniref:cytochrome c oxidase subunit 5b-2, mitochondrial-like n=1 Tax=Lotus japonicus TaxID=34305 RepID=UPI002589D226|nr:cytochrome c oxidase subunit 5b-2, mitochondrial-like [Lotus japonicus]
MWRRLFTSPHLKSLSATLSHSPHPGSALRFAVAARYVATQSAGSIKKTVEDVVPIATGHEREEIQADLEGRDILEINHPEGPFGTKEAPAVVRSYFDRRIVGCPGGEGEDEHDVVWFWLEKGKPHECPVCAQYFVLEVVGPGGDPYGHGDHH